MATSLLVIDAFTSTPFAGNPAAVCVLASPAEELWMQLVAREMNLSETAFLHPVEGGWSLRWFTPALEVDLCGHASLASAHALWETGTLGPDQEARFLTRSGWLTCRRDGAWIAMDFPATSLTPSNDPAEKDLLEAALGVRINSLLRTEFDLLAEVSTESILRGLKPDMNCLAALPYRGVIVTAPSASAEFDFVSRFFAPACGIPEDPVTGSAHCALGPYWQAKLGKSDFTAFQASTRGGLVKIGVRKDSVLLRGQAVLMSRVELLH
jgi:PhzF family phenazine biosynthesis protein